MHLLAISIIRLVSIGLFCGIAYSSLLRQLKVPNIQSSESTDYARKFVMIVLAATNTSLLKRLE